MPTTNTPPKTHKAHFLLHWADKLSFTLIEWMLLAAIAFILAAVFVGPKRDKNLDGITVGGTHPATQCIAGHQFVAGQHGAVIQIIDSAGRGVPCH